MTTNSFGTSPLPKFDYEPVFAKAARGGLPVGARVAAVAAATGLAYYATSKPNQSHPPHHHNQQPAPSSFVSDSSFNKGVANRQFLPNRLSDTLRKRQNHQSA